MKEDERKVKKKKKRENMTNIIFLFSNPSIPLPFLSAQTYAFHIHLSHEIPSFTLAFRDAFTPLLPQFHFQPVQKPRTPLHPESKPPRPRDPSAHDPLFCIHDSYLSLPSTSDTNAFLPFLLPLSVLHDLFLLRLFVFTFLFTSLHLS